MSVCVCVCARTRMRACVEGFWNIISLDLCSDKCQAWISDNRCLIKYGVFWGGRVSIFKHGELKQVLGV